MEKRRSNPPSPRKNSPKKPIAKEVVVVKEASSSGGSGALSLDSLAKLNDQNAKAAEKERKVKDKKAKEVKDTSKEKVVTGRVIKERIKHKHRRKESGHEEKRKSRVVSGPELEQGRGRRGGLLQPKKEGRKWG